MRIWSFIYNIFHKWWDILLRIYWHNCTNVHTLVIITCLDSDSFLWFKQRESNWLSLICPFSHQDLPQFSTFLQALFWPSQSLFLDYLWLTPKWARRPNTPSSELIGLVKWCPFHAYLQYVVVATDWPGSVHMMLPDRPQLNSCQQWQVITFCFFSSCLGAAPLLGVFTSKWQGEDLSVLACRILIPEATAY